MSENEIGRVVVDCAVKLHIELGPGLLESVYEILLTSELIERGLAAERQVPVPLYWKGIYFDFAFVADVVIEKKVIVELKSVENLSNAHMKQVLTYLKLTGMKLGYLLNFGEARMKDGIVRVINGRLM